MQISVVQIGNSKGIRLNKMLLEKYEITDKIELILKDDCIIIKPIKSIKEPRQGWAEAFATMHQNGDDELLIDDIFEDENFEDLE
jgi:antitoxin MazE